MFQTALDPDHEQKGKGRKSDLPCTPGVCEPRAVGPRLLCLNGYASCRPRWKSPAAIAKDAIKTASEGENTRLAKTMQATVSHHTKRRGRDSGDALLADAGNNSSSVAREAVINFIHRTACQGTAFDYPRQEHRPRQNQTQARSFRMNSIRSPSMSTSGGVAFCSPPVKGSSIMVDHACENSRRDFEMQTVIELYKRSNATFAHAACNVCFRDVSGANQSSSRAGSGTRSTAPVRTVWPGLEWPTATPESQGLSGAAIETAAAYATKAGGGSGCIIRHGYLVKEWGDPEKLADIKSATKGVAGATLLGLARDRGLIKLDDRAVVHNPKIGQDKDENRRDALPRSRFASLPR